MRPGATRHALGDGAIGADCLIWRNLRQIHNIHYSGVANPSTETMTDQTQHPRTMRYTSRSAQDAVTWQRELRRQLLRLLMLDDLVSTKEQIALDPVILSTDQKEGYLLQEVELNITAQRRITSVVTLPQNGAAPSPAVVCIHGHGGVRHDVYDSPSIYRGFAGALAERGYATISTDIGQHDVYEPDRTLMGERLWDLMRCVDYLMSLSAVNASRIGCAGLSLGGEMAMWLGAMDERVRATVSAGFLTRMDQMEQNHCMCWRFVGLRELVDFADIYSLMAPRPLLCQNGLEEPPTQFTVPIATEALSELELIYRDLESPENVELLAHEEGHVVHLPSLLAFFDGI